MEDLRDKTLEMCIGIKVMNLTGIDWEKELVNTVKPQTLEINLKAFKASMEA